MYKRCIMILADGARADRFASLLALGKLPHIQETFCNTGGYHEATTVFPSTTGPAYVPFLAGVLPATANIPGIRWLNKARFAKPWFYSGRRRSYVGLETFLINTDITRGIKTIFNLLPKSYNIFNAVNRGVKFRHNLTRLMRIWYWYYSHLTDRWALIDRAATEKIFQVIKKPFEFCFAVYPAIDEYSHLAGPLAPVVDTAYAKLDDYIGQIRSELSKRGQLKDTLLWIVSDHGFTATHSHFCCNTFLEERGIRTFFYPLIFKRRCVAANMMSGNGMTHLYFKHPHGWDVEVDYPTLNEMYGNLIKDLLKETAVDICAVRGAHGNVEIFSRRGHATVQLSGKLLNYQVVTNDPFGYESLPSIMNAQEALDRTIQSDYPDAPYQISHLFQSPRTGDVVLSATPGYDFRKDYEMPEHHGSHGGLHREQMLIPICCNAKLADRPLRSIDVFPTMLQLMGKPIPLGIDGVSAVF